MNAARPTLGRLEQISLCALLALLLAAEGAGCGSKQAAAPDVPASDKPVVDATQPDTTEKIKHERATAPDKPAVDATDREASQPAAAFENVEPFSTPQATFEALRQAALAGDAPKILACFTTDGATELPGAVWLIGGFEILGTQDDKTDPNAPSFLAAMQEAYERHVPAELRLKHSSDLKQGESWPIDVDLGQPEDKIRAQVRAAVKQFKDPEAFFASMLKAFDTYAKQTEPNEDQFTMQSSRLEDLQIDGDRATGTLTVGLLGFEDAPICFVRSDGIWKIETLGDYTGGYGEKKDKSKK